MQSHIVSCSLESFLQVSSREFLLVLNVAFRHKALKFRHRIEEVLKVSSAKTNVMKSVTQGLRKYDNMHSVQDPK